MIKKDQPENLTQGVGPDEITISSEDLSSDRFEGDVSWSGIHTRISDFHSPDFSCGASYENVDSGPGNGGNDSRMI